MSTEEVLRTQWLQLRERLQRKQLLGGPDASLSLRVPGAPAMWFGAALDPVPRRVPLRTPPEDNGGEEGAHAAAYRARPDVGAIGWGGGSFGIALADFGGTMPQLFDEQARHLGPMAPAVSAGELAGALQQHRGNVLMVQRRVLCLGTTATRLALNAELFEKCAKAHVLAVATGGRVRALPWWVRWIANGRLRKDASRAEARFAQGLLPEESKGY